MNAYLSGSIRELVANNLLGWRELLLNSVQRLVNLDWFQLETDLLHVELDLLWDLFKDFLRQVASRLAFSKPHELNNIARDLLSSRVPERISITIKLLHHSESLITHTNDNDRAGQVSSSANQILDIIHVVDFTIGENQKHLVGHGVSLAFSERDELPQNFTEVGWA